MLSYSLRANAAWRAGVQADSAFDRSNVHSTQSAVVPSMDRRPRFAENNLNWHHKNKVTDAEVESLLAAIEEA